MKKPILPFNKAFIGEAEKKHLFAALADGHLCGDGPFTQRCREFLQREVPAPCALLTTSCTHALEMAAMLLNIEEGDEVIVPSFTFVSSANAFVLHRARPVFADIRPDTLNLDERALEKKITKRTKAIIVVHYAGVACEMDPILALAKKKKIAVIEDNAHGLFGAYKKRPLGTLGSLSATSFHVTKNFTCGEGGALFVNDKNLVHRAEILREKGTDRTHFLRGKVDKYTWRDVGSSYVLSDLLAALLWAQFSRADEIRRNRKRLWEGYRKGLAGWAKTRKVSLPVVPAHCTQAHHLYYMLMPTAKERSAIIKRLREAGVPSAFHYLPLHLSDMGRKFGGRPGDCPVTEDVCARLIRLPFYSGMTEEDQRAVLEAVLAG